MTSSYSRSEILSFSELTEEQKQQAISLLDNELAEETSYVLFGVEVLPLCNFVRLKNNPIWHGVYGMTYFSGYYIKLNKSNDEALVAYKYSA